MKISIPGLSSRDTRGGTRYYWTPSPTLRKAGWKAMTLDREFETAVAQAKAQNARVEEWRGGGARPRQIARFVQRQSFAALCAEYERGDSFTRKAASTQREYRSCLRQLERWAGEYPVEWVTRARVQALKNALLTPAEPGGPLRHARTRNMLAVLYNVMQVAVNADRLAGNPAAKAGVEGGTSRTRVAAEHEIEALIAAADRLGRASVGTAILMGLYFGQRPGDLLAATWSSWRAGRLRIRQSKTKVWVNVRARGPLRPRMEALFAEATKASVFDATATILVNEQTGERWNERVFNRAWNEVKAEAIAPTTEGVVPCLDIDDLQFRDLRRTAVVRLAEAEVDLPGITAITGHKIEYARRILEVYMPRTTPMADAAVDRAEAHEAALASARDAAKKGGNG